MRSPFPNHTSLCEPRQPIIVSRENGCEHRAYNKGRSRVLHYRIDGDVIHRNQTGINKCDYLVLNVDKKIAYFIETKRPGCNLMEAADQIDGAIKELRHRLTDYQQPFCVRIVYKHGATHALRRSEFIKWQAKYPNQIVRSTPLEEII